MQILPDNVWSFGSSEEIKLTPDKCIGGYMNPDLDGTD